MKGFKTELTTVPSFVYYQSEDGSTHDTESPIVVEYYRDATTFVQGDNVVLVSNDYLDDFLKAVKANREQANKFLK